MNDYVPTKPTETEGNAVIWSKGGKKLFYILLAVVVGYYLWGWHKEHVLQYWPFAIFLLCPLMHVFMHGGHGSHGDHGSHSGHGSNDKQGDARR